MSQDTEITPELDPTLELLFDLEVSAEKLGLDGDDLANFLAAALDR